MTNIDQRYRLLAQATHHRDQLICIACCAGDEDEHRCGRDGLDGMDGREGSGTDAFFTEDRD